VNADLSVAPEIAQLADPFIPARPAVAALRTAGRVAGDLADLAATPERWWDLVRFDSGAPVRIPLPQSPGTWLLVLPPGTATDCDCVQATALAGEAVETKNQGETPGGAVRHARCAPAASGCTVLAPRTTCTPSARVTQLLCIGLYNFHISRGDDARIVLPQRILRIDTALFGRRPASK